VKTYLKVTPDYGYIPIDEDGIKYTYNRKPGDIVECTIKQESTSRTVLQNRSLHKYLTQIAQDLADAGLDMREVVKLPINPTLENVKENLFHPVMTAMYPDIHSTKDLDTKQVQAVYEVFNSAMGERLGVSRDWPSIDSQINESRIL